MTKTRGKYSRVRQVKKRYLTKTGRICKPGLCRRCKWRLLRQKKSFTHMPHIIQIYDVFMDTSVFEQCFSSQHSHLGASIPNVTFWERGFRFLTHVTRTVLSFFYKKNPDWRIATSALMSSFGKLPNQWVNLKVNLNYESGMSVQQLTYRWVR